MVGLICVDSGLSYASWKGFLRGLRKRDLDGVQRVASDVRGGIVRTVFAEDDPATARAMYRAACGLVSRPCRDAAAILESVEADALGCLDFPAERRRRMRTNNVQERLDREIKRR